MFAESAAPRPTVSSGAADMRTPTSGDGNGGVTEVLGGIPGHIAVMHTKAAKFLTTAMFQLWDNGPSQLEKQYE